MTGSIEEFSHKKACEDEMGEVKEVDISFSLRIEISVSFGL